MEYGADHTVLGSPPVVIGERLNGSVSALIRTLCFIFLVIVSPLTIDSIAAESDSWKDLRDDVVGDGPILDGSGNFTLNIETRASKPAEVPVSIRQLPGSTLKFVSLVIVIDENPSPVVARVQYGSADLPLDFRTRIRIDSYGYVRAIAQTQDGERYMVSRYVKASGGCSAPSVSGQLRAQALRGKMKLEIVDRAGETPDSHLVRLKMYHPNNSGLQMNQVTHLFLPAKFIHQVVVKQSGKVLWQLSSGISISENPTFEFPVRRSFGDKLVVQALDTDGESYLQSFSLGTSISSTGKSKPISIDDSGLQIN